MPKYSFELKLQVVNDYLKGKGSHKFLAKQYRIKSSSQVKQWVKLYKEFGEEGLKRKRKNKTYPVQTKLDAIECYLTSELSYWEVALLFKIENPSLIARWASDFRKDGIDGLSGTPGRPSKMSKEKSCSSSKKAGPEELSKIKELEKQVRYLQIENAYLKELRRLRLKDTHKRTSGSQESSTASEDTSN